MTYIVKTYHPDDVAWFRKTKEPNGLLGNMAGGMPLFVNGIEWGSSEALYQAARYPDRPDIQEAIRVAHNGFAAKLVSKANYEYTRPDWNDVRVDVMLNVLKIKLVQHRTKIAPILKTTKDIVEWSTKDDFWGAKPQPDGTLLGQNVLGKLWMGVRELDFFGFTILDCDTSYFPKVSGPLEEFNV